VPVALAVAALLGYQYTAHELAARLLWTAWLVFGVLILYQLLLRWLFVARRRLALERARKRREEEEEREATTPEGAPVPTEEAEVSLHVIGSQTRSLLRTMLAIGFVVGLWLVWSPLLPALGMLTAVRVWPGLSLAAVGGAVIVVIVTVIAARNIPGLLEIALLQRLPIEPGVRFAISTICRYVIIIIGIVMAGQAIGIGWEKVQWLAAAVTVGLGFGLQEIFANFVSGLIILLERPMRVGDVVTVGEVTGTVSRIRMRASTITDWDRKELVVPNKEFITGRLINWSLSDRVLRVVVPVGIAYGSDTEKARDLLLKVARQHPDVLSEPEPSALFLGFGGSALNFELRVFIPTVDVRLRVQHDLHMAVDRAFREAGIVIAFPQQDVHLDMAEGPLRIQHLRDRAEDEGAAD
jgi:potassium efflux system protein